MSYVYEITNYPDSGSLGILSEILLVTICISTAIFLRTKNPYISYLSFKNRLGEKKKSAGNRHKTVIQLYLPIVKGHP